MNFHPQVVRWQVNIFSPIRFPFYVREIFVDQSNVSYVEKCIESGQFVKVYHLASIRRDRVVFAWHMALSESVTVAADIYATTMAFVLRKTDAMQMTPIQHLSATECINVEKKNGLENKFSLLFFAYYNIFHSPTLSNFIFRSFHIVSSMFVILLSKSTQNKHARCLYEINAMPILSA